MSERMTAEQALKVLRENLHNPERGVVHSGIRDNDRTRAAIQALLDNEQRICNALARPAVPEGWRKVAEGAIAFVDAGHAKTHPLTAEVHIKCLAQLLLSAAPEAPCSK